jgi:hypothetical protein
MRASHAASGVVTDTIAGRGRGRAGPATQWRGSSSTDDTARDAAASRTRTAIQSESARQHAAKTAATTVIRR